MDSLKNRLLVGNCLDTIKTLADDSIDSIVTDPPYEIGFMGKGWDSTGIAYSVELWKECLRVLKPGGHLLSFGATRSYHRMAVAIEDAGFEIRDSIHWTYGSGFPKSMNISKAIDKAAGAKREVVGEKITGRALGGSNWKDGNAGGQEFVSITTPATKAAKQWDGWGTALKPSHEPIVVARKPINQTVAENVLQYGTGAINIDATRVGSNGGTSKVSVEPKERTGNEQVYGVYNNVAFGVQVDGLGRFPANTLLTHNHDCDTTCTPNCPIELLDQQSGISKSTGGRIGKKAQSIVTNVPSGEYEAGDPGFGDTGGASRFFHNSQWTIADDLTPFIYQAKPGKKERNAGLEGLGAKRSGTERMNNSNGRKQELGESDRLTLTKNFHPTVKPVELMRYLIKLVTPPKGIVLDPFLGSGTTAVAATLEGFEWRGCELTEDYLPIIKGRINWATKERKKATDKAEQLTLDSE